MNVPEKVASSLRTISGPQVGLVYELLLKQAALGLPEYGEIMPRMETQVPRGLPLCIPLTASSSFDFTITSREEVFRQGLLDTNQKYGRMLKRLAE